MISFLTGLVLTLLAIYLAIMIGSCLVGFYFVKKLVKDDDKEQNEVVYSICDCNHLLNNDNIRSYMNMVMTAAGLLLVVLSVEMHPDFLSMELGMLIGIIGICLVYIPLINERKECDDCRYKRE